MELTQEIKVFLDNGGWKISRITTEVKAGETVLDHYENQLIYYVKRHDRHGGLPLIVLERAADAEITFTFDRIGVPQKGEYYDDGQHGIVLMSTDQWPDKRAIYKRSSK